MSSDTDTQRPATLRPHHLYCLRFFRGEGYGEDFGTALREALAAEAIAGVRVVEGVDDVCRACPDVVDGVCGVDRAPAWTITTIDALAARLLGVSAGDRVGPGALDARATETLAEWRAGACTGCDYAEICAPRIEEYTT